MINDSEDGDLEFAARLWELRVIDYLRQVARSVELAGRGLRDRIFDILASARRVRLAVWRSLSQEDKLIYCRFEDHDLIVDPGDLVGKTVLERGHFDRLRTEIIAQRAQAISPGRTVLEVGANIGTQTIYFLKSGFTSVMCLEPDPSNLRTLEMNLRINRLEERVRLFPVAAGGGRESLPSARTRQLRWSYLAVN